MVSSINAYLVFLGLIPIERGIELALSRRTALLRTRIRAEEEALGKGYAAAFSALPRFLPRLHGGP